MQRFSVSREKPGARAVVTIIASQNVSSMPRTILMKYQTELSKNGIRRRGATALINCTVAPRTKESTKSATQRIVHKTVVVRRICLFVVVYFGSLRLFKKDRGQTFAEI